MLYIIINMSSKMSKLEQLRLKGPAGSEKRREWERMQLPENQTIVTPVVHPNTEEKIRALEGNITRLQVDIGKISNDFEDLKLIVESDGSSNSGAKRKSKKKSKQKSKRKSNRR